MMGLWKALTIDLTLPIELIAELSLKIFGAQLG